MSDPISICLPKGGAMKALSAHFEKIGFPIKDYNEKNRTYRPEVEGLPVRAKIMAEKDVAIQLAVGNYDIGFCGTDWIMEHIVRYRATKLYILKKLGLNKKSVYACSGIRGNIRSVDDLRQKDDFITIVSEYPNLSENFAIRKQLGMFKIFSAWGSVEGYPPEHADIVILSVNHEKMVEHTGLYPVSLELESELCLIVNRTRFIDKNLSPILSFFLNEGRTE